MRRFGLAFRRAGARLPIALALTLLLAFALRFGVRVHLGERSTWTHGYTIFLYMAREITARHFALDGVELGGRPPVYPYLLALAGAARANFLGVVLLQSMIGVGTVLCTYLIGRELFSTRVGLMAAVAAAVYPYYVVHDTAIQETSAVTLFSALSTYLLLIAARSRSVRFGAMAGGVLGATVLTRLTMLPFAVLGLLWLGVWAQAPRTVRTALTCAAALPLLILVLGWVAWNVRTTSRVTLSDGVASQLWLAHNPGTFSAYPDSSIDLSRRRSMRMLSPGEQAEYASVRRDGGALEAWFARRAWHYARDNAMLTLRNSLRMLVTGFSWRLSPRAKLAKQLAYALSYGPIVILGLVGFLLSRSRWRDLGVIYANFIGFVIVTAIFWAHTSHRVHLDIFLMIFAAFAADRILECFARRSGRKRDRWLKPRAARWATITRQLATQRIRLRRHFPSE